MLAGPVEDIGRPAPVTTGSRSQSVLQNPLEPLRPKNALAMLRQQTIPQPAGGLRRAASQCHPVFDAWREFWRKLYDAELRVTFMEACIGCVAEEEINRTVIDQAGRAPSRRRIAAADQLPCALFDGHAKTRMLRLDKVEHLEGIVAGGIIALQNGVGTIETSFVMSTIKARRAWLKQSNRRPPHPPHYWGNGRLDGQAPI